jgi:Flp pilus assembly protein TadD
VRRTVSVLLLWACATALARCRISQAVNSVSQDDFSRGRSLLGDGRYAEAVTAFNSFKQGSPQDPKPYFYAGIALAQAGRLTGAASELSEAVRLAPARLEYRVFQAHVLTQLDQKAAAQNALGPLSMKGAAQQLDAAWLSLLADVYYRLQLIPEVLEVLDVWEARDPNNARIDLERGQACLVKGDTRCALASFESSIRKSKSNPQAYFELGKLLYQRNDLRGAKDALLQAVKQDAANPEYLYRLGSTLLAMRHPEEALVYLQRAEPFAAALSEVHLALARAYRERGDRQRAQSYILKFQAGTARQREQKDHLLAADRPLAQGERELDQGHPEAAKSLFKKALEADPNRWAPHAYLAEMLVNAGELEQAYPHLVKMQQLDPDSVVGNYLMASYWYKQRKYEEARQYAEKAKLSRPANSELRHMLGNIYGAVGRDDKAREEYQAAVELAPERVDFRRDLQRLTAQPSVPKTGLPK